MKSFDNARLMPSPLSNLVNNFGEGIRKIKFKSGHDDKKGENRRIKCKDCNCFSEHTNFKNNVTVQKCLCCNKNYEKSQIKRKQFLI